MNKKNQLSKHGTKRFQSSESNTITNTIVDYQ